MPDTVKIRFSMALVATSFFLVGCEVNEADKFFMKTYYNDGEIVEEVTGFAYVGKRRVVWAYDEEERGTIFTRYESCEPGDDPRKIYCNAWQEHFEKGNKGIVLITAKEDNYLTFSGDGYYAIIRNAADLFEF